MKWSCKQAVLVASCCCWDVAADSWQGSREAQHAHHPVLAPVTEAVQRAIDKRQLPDELRSHGQPISTIRNSLLQWSSVCSRSFVHPATVATSLTRGCRARADTIVLTRRICPCADTCTCGWLAAMAMNLGRQSIQNSVCCTCRIEVWLGFNLPVLPRQRPARHLGQVGGFAVVVGGHQVLLRQHQPARRLRVNVPAHAGRCVKPSSRYKRGRIRSAGRHHEAMHRQAEQQFDPETLRRWAAPGA